MQVIAMNAQIIQTLQITIPLMLSTKHEEDDYLGYDEDSQLHPQKLDLSKLSPTSTPNVSMGELLYPSFNVLIPTYVECILPHLSSLPDPSTPLHTFYSLLSFAFKT